MLSRDTWKEIFETIRKNKLRTFLTGFTVALGIFIYVVLFGMGNGLKNTFAKFFNDDAQNVFFVFPGRTTEPFKGYKANRRIEFENDDLTDIEENFSMLLEYITPRISRGATVTYKEESDNYTTRAVGPAHLFAEKTIIMKGRYLNETDILKKTKYAVIGRLVEQDLFKGEESIGKFIDVSGSVFKVIGVFQDDGGDNEERNIYIPFTTRQLIEKNNDKIDQIILAFKPEIGYAGAMAFEGKLDKFIRNKKIISPSDPNGIFIRNVADQFKQNQQFAGVLQTIISIIAFAVIISGMIGIGNIMVFMVKERTKEIGIRKALGATPKRVTNGVIFEAIFITTISGFVGLLIGISVLRSIGGPTLEDDYFITNPEINISNAIFVTILLIVFGAIAGYLPARRAAKIKPIVALRDE
jgi:putative ABC transport system permease protein